MKIENMNGLHAVVTGDIIGSSRLSRSKREKLFKVMTAGSKEVCQVFHQDVPLEIDIFRGDSWQLLVTRPRTALDAALFFRAFIKAGMAPERVDTRLAIATGTIELAPEERVSQGDGEAYKLSGRALEMLRGHENMTFDFPPEIESDLTRAVQAVVTLSDVIVTRWTPRQAEAVKGMMKGLNQGKIAAGWPQGAVSQQAVAQHLARAGWHGLRQGLNFVRNTLEKLA